LRTAPRRSPRFAPKRLRDQRFIYDHGEPAYVIERDGEVWRLLTVPQRDLIGIYDTARMAVEMARASIVRGLAGKPINGERERDAKRVDQIEKHQQAADRLRLRPSGGRFDGLTARKSGTPVNHGDREDNSPLS
jgi:hypothetical protein